LLSSALQVGYCGGAVLSMFNLRHSGRDPLQMLGIPNEWVAYAMMMVFLATACLMFVGMFESDLIQPWHLVKLDWRQERFLWFAVVICLYKNLSGSSAFTDTGQLNPITSIAFTIVFLIGPFSVIGLIQSEGARRWRFLLMLACSVYLTLYQGRRMFLYNLLVMIFAALRLSGWNGKISTARKLTLTVGILMLIVASNYFVLGMRVLGGLSQTKQGSTDVDVLGSLPIFYKKLINNTGTVSDATSNNLKYRPFVINYLALLSRGGGGAEPMWGRDASFSFEMALPGAAYRLVGSNKWLVQSYGTEEELANEHFHLPVYDASNSIMTAGYIDFGLAGAVFYPMLLCFVGVLVLRMVSLYFRAEGQLIAIVLSLSLFLTTENELVNYITGIRQILIAVVLWKVVYSLPAFTIRLRGRKGVLSRPADRGTPPAVVVDAEPV